MQHILDFFYWLFILPFKGKHTKMRFKFRKNLRLMGGRVQLLEDGYYYVLQSFAFKYDIMNHYYPGDHYINMKSMTEEINTGRIFERIRDGGPFGFMPDLVQELHKKVFISAEHNAIYGMNLTNQDVVYLFLIRCDSYKKVIDNFKNWSILKSFDEITEVFDVVESFPKNIPLTKIENRKPKQHQQQNTQQFGQQQ